MKTKLPKPTELSRITKLLDEIGIQYVRASVEATDKQGGKNVPTEVLLGSWVFHRTTGKYMFSGPILNPVAGANSKPN